MTALLDRLPDPGEMSDAELDAELVAHMAAADRAALVDPLTLARHLDEGRTLTRPHLRVISQALAEEMVPGQGGRVIIVTPPQVGKTELVAIRAPFRMLAQYPQLRGLIACYGQQFATKRGRAVRRLVQLYGERFGLHLAKGTTAAHDWALTEGGGIKAAGVGSGITGNPADFAVLDDVVKGRAEADSIRYREKLWDWYSGDLYTRLAPGAPIAIIGTRWHEDDLIGRLLAEDGTVEQGGRWRLIYLPAIAQAPDPKAGIPEDGLGREPGEPLPHPRIPTRDRVALLAHWTDKQRASTARDWGALYLGNPKPTEGALVSRELLKARRDFFPTAVPVKAAVAVDPSGGGRSTAGVVGGWIGDDGRLYLSHDRSGHMPTDQWAEAACLLAAEIGADKVIVEYNFGAGQALHAVRGAWDALRRRAEVALEGCLARLAEAEDGGEAGRAAAALAVAALDGGEAQRVSWGVMALVLAVANAPLPYDLGAAVLDSKPRKQHREVAAERLAEVLEKIGHPDADAATVAAMLATDRYRRLPPNIHPQNARRGKVLRAEPVAQQFVLDRIRFAAPLPAVEDEWATWQDGSPDSPGRIDASTHMALALLKIPGAAELVSSPAQVSRAQAAGSGAAGMPVIPRGGAISAPIGPIGGGGGGGGGGYGGGYQGGYSG